MKNELTRRLAPLVVATLLLAFVPLATSDYVLHIAIEILLWGFVYTAWSLMGKFGLVSLGHGAFLGIGAYVSPLLWNYAGLTPWLGIPIGVLIAMLLALVIGYPCFRLRVIGHYFALVTLALSQVALLTIVAARDITGGSLGMTPKAVGHSWYALQFPEKPYFYAIALVAWVFGIVVWHFVDIGEGRAALDAIAEDEGAAAAIGIDVMREKLRVTLASAALTAFGGALLSQYFMYVNPDTLSGIGVSLQIVFAAIAGGMYSAFGPTAGGLFTIALPEILRITMGTNFVGAANTIYGALLVIFIIFMPRGIIGWFESRLAAAPARS
ncbi:MAG TPA: branched-chain amino acid ABC transporter permease [Beijerinckiaceae bacterium]|jgi:branched-chain amino acid transport system permease protein|nr:branched-chain amino acid ABC transporter permease [Beijerinckiaceae bacterium]